MLQLPVHIFVFAKYIYPLYSKQLAEGGGALVSMQLLKFDNPRGVDLNGDYCDPGWYGYESECDHAFSICIEPYQYGLTG